MVNKKLLDEMVDKWWVKMGERVMGEEDIEQFIKDASLLGITHLDLLEEILEKYMDE